MTIVSSLFSLSYLSDILSMKLRRQLYLQLKSPQMTLKRYSSIVFFFFFFFIYLFICFGPHFSNILSYFMWQSCLVLINVQFLVNWHLHDVLLFAGALCSILSRYLQCVVEQGKRSAERLVCSISQLWRELWALAQHIYMCSCSTLKLMVACVWITIYKT